MVFLVDGQQRTLMVRAHGLLEPYWMPPGGHTDDGETSAEAACRELVEELDVHCAPEDLDEIGGCDKDVGSGRLTLFVAHRWADRPITLGPEIADARWVDIADCAALPTLPATDHGLALIVARSGEAAT